MTDIERVYQFEMLVEAVHGYAAPTDGVGGILVGWESEHAIPDKGHSRVVVPDAAKTALFRHGFRFASHVDEETIFTFFVLDTNKRTEVGFFILGLLESLPKAKGETTRVQCKTVSLSGPGAEGVYVHLGINCREFIDVPSREEPSSPALDSVTACRLVKKMYDYYAPEKSSQDMDAVMSMHAGFEHILLDKLVNKYGPLPPEDAKRKSFLRFVPPEVVHHRQKSEVAAATRTPPEESVTSSTEEGEYLESESPAVAAPAMRSPPRVRVATDNILADFIAHLKEELNTSRKGEAMLRDEMQVLKRELLSQLALGVEAPVAAAMFTPPPRVTSQWEEVSTEPCFVSSAVRSSHEEIIGDLKEELNTSRLDEAMLRDEMYILRRELQNTQMKLNQEEAKRTAWPSPSEDADHLQTKLAALQAQNQARRASPGRHRPQGRSGSETPALVVLIPSQSPPRSLPEDYGQSAEWSVFGVTLSNAVTSHVPREGSPPRTLANAFASQTKPEYWNKPEYSLL